MADTRLICKDCGSENVDFSWETPHESLKLYCLDCSRDNIETITLVDEEEENS